MFTSDYYSLSIEQVKKVCRYIPGLIMGDFRLVIYKDGEGLDEHSTAVVYAVVVNGHHFLLGEVGKDDVVVQDV